MSLIVVDMGQAQLLAAKNSAVMGLDRLRIIGQCIGIELISGDAFKVKLVVQSVQELITRESFDNGSSLEILVGEQIYRRCLGALVEGSVCDSMCCVVEGEIEAMDVRIWTLSDLKAFREFWNSSTGRQWRSINATYG
ncbi:LANO_0E15082g1_1 [Lachancea nothofagi CBS 11611]|uniref:LANO_0E15082g1_1 n=1 Tax=Lachancea nothofagi CBS 11611 TaxID=1266666 RepID=A0A1G4K0S6_9SACH|nr:LANO_0E15082g1_1 [Lachancea nothofagi CBS 11611]